MERYYDPEDEIIIDWADMEQFNGDGEMTQETWSDAIVEIDRGSGVLDMNWIEQCVYTAQEEAEQDRKHMKADALMDELRDLRLFTDDGQVAKDGMMSSSDFFADSGGFLGDK